MSSAPAIASPTSSVNDRRSRFRSMSSSRPGSKIGRRPARSASIFSGTMSRTVTTCPSSAKHAPVTSPTYPAPKTAIRAPAMSATLLTERSQALRDREHRLVRELVEEAVHHPVGGAVLAQDDHVQVRPRVVEGELAALDPVLEVRLLEDRRVGPVGLLDSPVVADGVRPVDEADGLVPARDAVHPQWLGRVGRRRLLEQERILE